jgi:hypothetical protein
VTRVVFLILDALPPRHVTADSTPTLAGLAREGGSSIGRAVLTSATYPNHATFATGRAPSEHRLLANWVMADGRPQPAQDVGPSGPTIFDAVPSSAAFVGDHNLIGVMGARQAAMHWPPDGVRPDGVALDGHGYATNAEVLPRLLPALDSFDLVVGHLNEPDTAAHVFGPDSDEALECYRATDADVAVIVDTLRARWDDTVLIVVSDHDQETVDSQDPIDLYGPAKATGQRLIPIPEGSGAVVWGDDDTAGAWLDRVAGVAGHTETWPGARIVWADPGRWFQLPRGFDDGPTDRGTHGGINTRNQVAIVAGGHPRAHALARWLDDQARVDATVWASIITSSLSKT